MRTQSDHEVLSFLGYSLQHYWNICFYTITWLLREFSLVVDRYLLKNTHTDGVKSTSDHVRRFVFLFSCTKNPSINHLNFYCIKQIDFIFPCMCIVKVTRTTVVTPLDFVACFIVIYMLWCHLWCITVHSHGKMLSIWQYLLTKLRVRGPRM